MGWQWQYGWHSNGRQSWWSNDWRNNTGSKPKGPARRPQTQSWELWTCQCGNVQTGSQCKSCKSKWWEVTWTRSDTAPGQKTGGKSEPPSHKPAEKQVLTALDTLLPKLPPGDDAHTLVEGLRDLLRGRAPAQSKRQKLKSVLDKLDYQRNRSKSIKHRLKAIEEEKIKLEKDLAEADIQTKALEEEQAQLISTIGPEVSEEESDEEEEEDDDDPPGMLTEEETKAMMARMHKGYLTSMLHAEIARIREQDPTLGGGAPPNNGFDGSGDSGMHGC